MTTMTTMTTTATPTTSNRPRPGRTGEVLRLYLTAALALVYLLVWWAFGLGSTGQRASAGSAVRPPGDAPPATRQLPAVPGRIRTRSS
jgi:hypothetical protein